MLNFTRYYLILGGAKVRFFSYIPKNDENIFVVYTFFNVFRPFPSFSLPFHFLSIPFHTIF